MEVKAEVKIFETADNADIVSNLKELRKVLKDSHLPQVQKWLKVRLHQFTFRPLGESSPVCRVAKIAFQEKKKKKTHGRVVPSDIDTRSTFFLFDVVVVVLLVLVELSAELKTFL